MLDANHSAHPSAIYQNDRVFLPMLLQIQMALNDLNPTMQPFFLDQEVFLFVYTHSH